MQNAIMHSCSLYYHNSAFLPLLQNAFYFTFYSYLFSAVLIFPFLGGGSGEHFKDSLIHYHTQLIPASRAVFLMWIILTLLTIITNPLLFFIFHPPYVVFLRMGCIYSCVLCQHIQL